MALSKPDPVSPSWKEGKARGLAIPWRLLSRLEVLGSIKYILQIKTVAKMRENARNSSADSDPAHSSVGKRHGPEG